MRLCYRFDKDQVDILKTAFKIDDRPDIHLMTKLAELFECDIRKVQKWFSNQRMVSRKMDGIMRSERCWFSPEHKRLLSESFEIESYPDSNEIARLAAYIGCNPKKIANWFVNNRRKLRRNSQMIPSANSFVKKPPKNQQLITKKLSIPFEIKFDFDAVQSSKTTLEPIEHKQPSARSYSNRAPPELEQIPYQVSCPCYSCYIAFNSCYSLWLNRQSEPFQTHHSYHQSNPSSSHLVNNCYCCHQFNS